MATVVSADGTKIDFTRAGDGPVLVLVGGGLDDGAENAALVHGLSGHFTVINYARRGRGGSGDTLPYAVEREIEDLAALIKQGAGSACLFGASSGGALALEAAAAGLPIDRIAVYEVPYQVEDWAVQAWTDYREQLAELLADDRRSAALELFMRLAGSTEDDVAAARELPEWASLQALAPTLAYDAACVGGGPPPVERLRAVEQPVSVMTGTAVDPGMTQLDAGFFDAAADAITAAVPNAERRVLTGVGHLPEPSVLAADLVDFLAR